MPILSQEQIESQLVDFPEWSQNGDALQRTFGFADFLSAMAFVGRAAELAEELQHHPDIMIRYNKVTLTISTHDAGGITEKDFGFVRLADGLASAV